MKIDTTTMLALGALVAAWAVMRKATGSATGGLIPAFAASKNLRNQVGAATQQVQPQWASEITNADGSAFENGWKYYNDGTAIDPSGSYYADGKKVWSPT